MCARFDYQRVETEAATVGVCDLEAQHEDVQCRICLSSDDHETLIAPCPCRGSAKWVHRECLDECVPSPCIKHRIDHTRDALLFTH